MKKLYALLLAILMAACMTSPAYAATITRSKALAIALKDAGLTKASVREVDIEQEKGRFEVEFRQTANNVEYEYEISQTSGKILEKSVDYPYKRTSSKSKIGKEAALKKVAKASGIKLSVVKGGRCSYTYKKSGSIYKVTFRHNGYGYEYKVLAPTGKIIEWEMTYLKK